MTCLSTFPEKVLLFVVLLLSLESIHGNECAYCGDARPTSEAEILLQNVSNKSMSIMLD